MLQVHILLLIWKLSGNRCDSPVSGIGDPLFILTFSISVATASFGISNFLKSGPCRIIRNNIFCSGFGTLSYILLLLNIASTVIAKGYALIDQGRGPFTSYVDRRSRHPHAEDVSLVLLLPGIFLSFTPQLTMVSNKL